MALQFIIGRSGSGKTHWMYETLMKESIEHSQQEFFFIVPEQYTLQTQKDVVEKHPQHGTMNIDIVSFPRLAYRIFEELSYHPKAILEDMGKRMVLRKILEDHKKELQMFGRSIQKPGFLDQLKSMISELYQYQIDSEKLEEIKQSQSGNLQEKLQDIGIVQRAFEQYIDENFIVAEQLLEVLTQMIGESQKVKDSIIFIDGFTGFTPVQNQLIGVLLKYAKKVVVSVTGDSWLEKRKFVREYELFSMSSRTIYQLKEIAKEAGVELLPSICLTDESYRQTGKEDLQALEAGIFRYPVPVWEKKPEHITLFSSRDRLEEVRRICETIASYVRKKGYRYRDMAVIVGDMDSYGAHFEQCLEELHIPYFMDRNKSILNNPCVESIRGLLQLTKENFSYASVFRYLKAGMSSLTPEEVDRLENYALARGINSKKRWKEEFKVVLRGQSEEDLMELNQLRAQFMDEVWDFYAACKKKKISVREYMTILYQFLRHRKFEEKMRERQQAFEQDGNYVMAKTYGQIYPHLLQLMDKMADILGNEIMSVDEMAKIMETGLEEMKVGVIPPGMDHLVVGDLTRTRLKEIKVLFLAGINDGSIPSSPAGNGILNDYEREKLEAQGVKLAETAIQTMYTEQFYLYLAIAKPQEHLYVSYATVADDGKSLRPSYFIQRIQKVLPGLKLTEMKSQQYLTTEYGLHGFIQGLRRHAEGQKDVEQEPWKEMGQILGAEQSMEMFLDGAYYQNKEENLSLEAAKEIYGEILKNSVSRLEQFESCAYAHFLRYGLMLQGREEFKIRPMDMGNIFHRSLELISKKIQVTYESWKELDDQEQEILSEDAVDEAIKEWNADLLNSSHRNRYLIDIVKRMTKRTLWALLKHLENSDFEPYAFEIAFSNYENLESTKMDLDNGGKMYLRGKIDRVDKWEDENGIYLKVIDYKSGYAKFDLSELYYGLQMQLALYMNAVIEMEEKKAGGKPVIPAGMFYYSLKDPIVEYDLEKDPQDLILEKLKMDGYANSDYQIIEHMETDLPDKCVSIPVIRSKKGYHSRSKVMDTESFEHIREHTRKKLLEAGNEIMKGNIAISPYKKSKETACEYCEFKEICHFDSRMDRYRELPDIKQKELLDMWKEGADDGMDR